MVSSSSQTPVVTHHDQSLFVGCYSSGCHCCCSVVDDCRGLLLLTIVAPSVVLLLKLVIQPFLRTASHLFRHVSTAALAGTGTAALVSASLVLVAATQSANNAMHSNVRIHMKSIILSLVISYHVYIKITMINA